MKRLGFLVIILSLLPLYLLFLGITDAAAVGPVSNMGPIGWLMLMLFLAFFLAGIGLFLFGKS